MSLPHQKLNLWQKVEINDKIAVISIHLIIY